MKKSPLYTRTGDNGTTSLVGGQRVAKNSPRVNAYGSVDELNSMIGLLNSFIQTMPSGTPDIKSDLNGIGSLLFDIGAYLATDNTSGIDANESTPFTTKIDKAILKLERDIDTLDAAVPPLRQFVIPGGCIAAAYAHVARTVCRRAERDILTLSDTGAAITPVVLNYINRLSDYLFILARYLNHSTSTPEPTWRQ